MQGDSDSCTLDTKMILVQANFASNARVKKYCYGLEEHPDVRLCSTDSRTLYHDLRIRKSYTGKGEEKHRPSTVQ